MSGNGDDPDIDQRLPPGWNWADASTPGGFIYVEVWREFPDSTAGLPHP